MHFQGKLVLYVSKQIIIKSKITSDALHDELADYPNTRQWLSCVGLPENTIMVNVSVIFLQFTCVVYISCEKNIKIRIH